MAADVELAIRVTKRGDGADKVARDLKQAARAADDLDDNLKQVDRRLLETKALAAAAGKEFLKTGDSSPLKQILKDGRELERVKKSLTAFQDEVDKGSLIAKGKKAGRKLVNAFGDEIKDGGPVFGQGFAAALKHPAVLAGVAAGAAVLGPVLGGAVNAALLTAVGGGVLAGGIVLAARDPRVQGAWADFGRTALDQLISASSVLTGPLIESAHTFRDAFSTDAIRKDFQALSPLVGSLTDGLIGFARKAMPGIDEAVRASVPVIRQLAAELPGIGAAFARMMHDFAASVDGAVTGMKILASTVRGTFDLIGFSIRTASDELAAFDKLVHGDFTGTVSAAADAGGQFSDTFLKMIASAGGVGAMAADMITWLRTLHALMGTTGEAGQALGQTFGDIVVAGLTAGERAAAEAADSFRVLQQQITQTDITASTLAGQMTDKLIGSMLSLDQSALGVAESLTHVSDAFKENGRHLDINTAKGQANREAVLAAVTANLQQYDALIRAGAGADVAAAQYNENTAALERQLHKAHLTQGQIDGLIGKYRSVPDVVDTNIVLQGLTAAINSLDQLLRRLNGLDYDRTIFVDVFPRIHGGKGGQLSRDVGFAEGGWVAGRPGEPVPAIVHGGEYVLSREMVAGRKTPVGLPRGSTGGGDGATVRLVIDGGDDDLKRLLRKWVRIDGGGNVQTAFGR